MSDFVLILPNFRDIGQFVFGRQASYRAEKSAATKGGLPPSESRRDGRPKAVEGREATFGGRIFSELLRM